MEITINTHTDDLPAIIRMLQAYCGPTPTSQTGPVVEIAGVPADKLYSGDALKAAIEPEEADHADGPDHEDGPEFVGFEGRAADGPELALATVENYVGQAGGSGGNGQPPKSLFDAPPPPHSDVTVDAAGLPWDARIHSGAKSKLANGNWKLLRGVDPALVASVEAELRGAPKPAACATEPATSTTTPPSVAAPSVSAPVPLPPPAPAPIAAPAASATPKPITNAAELVAAVMDKRFTTDQVNAACQAVGVENVASLLAKQDKLPEVLKELGV